MKKVNIATVGDWEHRGHKIMRWSMYDSTLFDKAWSDEAWDDALEMAYRAQPLVLDAPKGVEDGVYDVEYSGEVFGPGCYVYGQPELEEDCHVGVTIVEGKYVPVATAEAVYRVVLKAFGLKYGSRQFDHVYIEALDFNSETKRFVVRMGS